MNIDFYFEEVEEFDLPVTALRHWLMKIVVGEKKRVGELSFIFCSDRFLFEMNREFLHHDYLTDVITFDYVQDNVISGDVYMSVERIKENAAEFKVSFFEEISRVMVHGVLHLLGYKDKTEYERAEMTEKEDFYIGRFKRYD